ncbi:kinase-like protein [Aaosphaeria arxii CBS 175.79]|uniref:Autophagy-related protein 1 n=1 Tax=Aaosphaeria arxii CBS 175.79 TaxID=1450172 RepID=A0A6A5XTZ9_9PLEO|nr:kinase-like protein [Aaosphaeria arxii CBS 175.79]KAF2016798.1 kinase-like protein [Aaosphaeria arxii CBS 175.79]
MSPHSFSIRSVRPHARTLVSCSAGFSRPGGAEIRSLDDLLRAIQPLNIRLYDAASLRNPQKVGEGACYTVFRYTDTGMKEAVAVKQIKLPDDSNNHQAFRNRVDCVLKDIEVMCHPPIAQHENILTLLGYGWGLHAGDVIPFIVTDFAALGTLRDYLQAKRVSMQSKLALCSQVACGLNRLHWASVAHGDLKLDNVLVFRNRTGEGAGTYETQVVAKLSDFGHACLFSDDQGDGVTQTYLGTPWYLAPELRQGTSLKSVEFLACDIWALGLLCWEVVRDGVRYFRLPEISALLGHSELFEESSLSADTLGRIFDLCPALAEAATTSIYEPPYNSEFRPFQQQFINGILRKTLQVDPSKRQRDITKLPFIFGSGLHLGLMERMERHH